MTPDVRELIDLLYEQEKELLNVKQRVDRLEAHSIAAMQVFAVIGHLLAVKGAVSREELAAALDGAESAMRASGASDEALRFARAVRTMMTQPAPTGRGTPH